MNKYQGVNLYVKNLDDSVDDEKLATEFSTCGTITSAKVMTDDKKNNKGFGFVCFSTPEEATRAVTELNGKIIAGKPIYVALAQRKDQRRQQLEAQFSHKNTGIRLQQQAQASGMTGSPIYGAPVFYPPARGGFVYPPMVRGRFPTGRGGYVPFVVPQVGRGQPPMRGRGKEGRGRGGVAPPGVPGYPIGIKYNANVRNPQAPVQAPSEAANNAMSDERKQQIGEALYPIIFSILKNVNQDDATGKITGMILDSFEQPELMQFLENHDTLKNKVVEALEVLTHHNAELAKQDQAQENGPQK